MGLNTTSTMASSKSFGFSRGRKRLLTQYTFPSGTSTWTAPAGVTSLVSAIGKGSNGTAESSAPLTTSDNFPGGYLTYTGANCFGVNVGTSYYSDESSRMSTFQSELAAVTATSWTGIGFTAGFYMYCTDQAVFLRYISTYYHTVQKIGGTVYKQISAGSNGSATTGFGLNFPGGTQYSPTASNTTYNNVAVVPGTQYTIVNNGSLAIEYYL